MRRTTVVRAASLAASAVMMSLVFGAPALASSSTSNVTGHCDPSSSICGINPALTGPAPAPAISSSCPAFLATDHWSLDFVDGNSVFHETTNKNGGWGTGTAQGEATLTTSDTVVQYSGHLTEWFGGGGNKAGQTDGGFTLSYTGSGVAGNLSIHIEQGGTTNNGGNPTASHFRAVLTC